MRHSKKVQNIRRFFSKYMILLLTIMLAVTALLFSVVQYENVKNTALTDLGNLCQSVGDNVDLQIYQLDTITLNTINSNELRNTLESYVTDSLGKNNYGVVKDKQELSALLTSLKGFDYSVRQLSIYSTKDMGFGVGDYLGELKEYSDTEWYQNTLKASGLKFVSIGSLDNSGALKRGNTYYSIARTYYNTYHQPIGTIESRKYYNEVFDSAISVSSSYNPLVFVYDENGKLLCPYSNINTFDYYKYHTNSVTKINGESLLFPDYVFSYKMPHSGYTTIMYVNGESFIDPVLDSLKFVLMLFVLLYLLGLIMVSYMAKKLSNPIRKIYYFLLNKEPSNQNALLDLEPTNIREIDKLVRSINEYIHTSEVQTKNMLGLQQQEIQAQMLALQSQMNPHFLYNSLACIEEMAKEGLNDSVSQMVQNISTILRAISSNKEQVISVEEELDLCDMYLECLSLRFGDDLNYEFDVEDTMFDYMVPKLCIQLLVENAIKSTTTQSAPWNILVRGYIEGDSWYIKVIDNGPGFDKDVDMHLREQMDSILETGVLPSLKIEGMGILNIFIRLYLLDGITFLFDFGNNVEGGAFVKIGRAIDKSMPKID